MIFSLDQQKTIADRNTFRAIRKMFFATIILLLIFTSGVAGFFFIENYSLIDAIYMTTITISTVGFGVVKELSSFGKLFTVFLIIFSLGVFTYFITSFTRYIFEGIFFNYYRNRKIEKKMRKLKKHVIICGYGRNGKQARLELKKFKKECIIVDKNKKIIDELREENKFLFYEGNAVKDEVLEAVNIENAAAIIATLPNDADNLFIVITARHLNPNIKIISRASNNHSDRKLIRAGADNIIMPDKLGGEQMAKLVTQPDILELIDNILLQEEDNVNLTEIFCTNMADKFKDKTIAQIDIRNKSGANIIALKKHNGEYVFNPSSDIKLHKEDKLFVLANPEQLNKLKFIMTD